MSFIFSVSTLKLKAKTENEVKNNRKTRKIPFIIVSAGLDFVIRHFLELKGLKNKIEIRAVKTTIQNGRTKLSLPKLLDKASIDFKEDLVKYYTKQGKRVIYIGDGTSDYNAIKNADFPFVIKDSKLADLCKRTKVLHKEITDFQKVINFIKTL